MSTILECKNLSKAYGNKTALSHIDLALEGGHIIGLLGPNRQRQNDTDQTDQWAFNAK